jgi:predicted dehydrogenase
MESGTEWRKKVHVSYAEAFKEELQHFYDCLHEGKDPLTNGADGREDIVVLQRILAAAAPKGLGGEAAQ